MAPVAVEPRKINPPGTSDGESAEEADEGMAVAETVAPDQPEQVGKQGSSPLIPILAGIIGIVVVGLLVKVMKAR